MDPDVVNNPAHSQTIRDDLKTVPSLSIAMEADDMFGGSGIYSLHNQGLLPVNWTLAMPFDLPSVTLLTGAKDAIPCILIGIWAAGLYGAGELRVPPLPNGAPGAKRLGVKGKPAARPNPIR